MRTLPLLAVVLFLPSCVGTPGARGTWVKPGVDPDVARRDRYECEREAVLRRTAEMPAETGYERCMRERGYVRHGDER